MTCIISNELLKQLENHLEEAYPEEGAGFLLGNLHEDNSRQITQLILLENSVGSKVWSRGPNGLPKTFFSAAITVPNGITKPGCSPMPRGAKGRQ